MMRRYLLIPSAVIALSGCGTLGGGNFGLEEIEPASEYAAGEVNISTFEPIPWYTVSDQLAPKFGKKSANELLAEVAPVVGGDSFSASRRTSIGLQAQVGGSIVDNSSSSSDSTATDNDGIVTSSSSSEAISSTSRTTPDLITIDADTLKSLITAPSAPSAATDFSFDPQQKYRAAAGLFHSIQLLDRYLEQSPGKAGETAYLVRQQVTISPYAHQQPYDIYTRLTFELESDTRDGSNNVRVFPLVIADNLERINTRRISEDLLSIQASLSGRGGAFSGGAGVSSALEKLRQLVGSDLNSLVTFSQPDDNSLVVRFGAPFNPISGWATRARTYDVTAVVLIPDDSIEKFKTAGTETAFMQVFAESSYRHARTGILLQDVSESDINAIGKDVRRFWKDLKGEFPEMKSPEALVRSAIYAKEESDADDVIRAVSVFDLTTQRNLRRARIARSQSYSRVEFSKAEEKLPDLQLVMFNDDGKASAVQLTKVKLGDPQQFVARLVFDDAIKAPLLSTSATYDGRVAAWTFPSLAALNIEFSPSKVQLLLDLTDDGGCFLKYGEVGYTDLAGENPECGYYPLRALKSSASPARTVSFKIASYVSQFNDGNAGGIVNANARVNFDAIDNKKPAPTDIDSYRLSLKGATMKNLVPLQNDGTRDSGISVTLIASKNAAKIPVAGIQKAYRIELQGKEQPADVEIEIIVEALNKAGKVIPNEKATMKFQKKAR